MFSRLFGSDSRACDKLVESVHMPSSTKNCPLTQSPPKDRPLKRRRPSTDGQAVPAVVTPIPPPTKRLRLGSGNGVPVTTAPVARKEEPKQEPARRALSARELETAREAIEFQFSLETRLKHDEVRFIDQEIAKCQIALEQLRRCHMIPYPTACPTPQQMLDIASGKGAFVRPRPGESVPKWGAPFGVVDGPYSRHYAKWLIPDPVFDGVRQDMQTVDQVAQPRSATEGRTTRNSFADPSTIKPRSGRGSVGQKLQALSSGYPQPKEKVGPCILKRSDGLTVKLVCIDPGCLRDNFSSTQGFINHCRIAHKLEFKSHEEAAMKCGQAIEVDDAAAALAPKEKCITPVTPVPTLAAPTPATATGLVHPLARADQETVNSLSSRMKTARALQIKLATEAEEAKARTASGRKKMSASAGVRKNNAKVVPSVKTPYLSKLMQSKKFGANLKQQVDEATAPVEEDALMSDEDESGNTSPNDDSEAVKKPTFTSDVGGIRTPAVSRVPVAPTAPTSLTTDMPLSNKGRSPHLSFATPSASPPLDLRGGHLIGKHEVGAGLYGDDELDMEELSPNPSTSNNAPSLVSDDGLYDDSDEGSSSENSDSEVESMSDVAEISLEEEDPGTPRAARYHRGSTGASAVKLKEKESKHVTFVSPVRTGKSRRN